MFRVYITIKAENYSVQVVFMWNTFYLIIIIYVISTLQFKQVTRMRG